MKISLLQAKLWPLHADKTISFLRSSRLRIIRESPWTGILGRGTRRQSIRSWQGPVASLAELGGTCLCLGWLTVNSWAVT